jgi:hypothetical protein
MGLSAGESTRIYENMIVTFSMSKFKKKIKPIRLTLAGQPLLVSLPSMSPHEISQPKFSRSVQSLPLPSPVVAVH